MLRRTYCASCIGVDSITVTIEVDVTQGISFYLVGLPDSAVRESQQRITTALKAAGARIPGKRIVVNMAPADIRKEGSSFDLAINLMEDKYQGYVDKSVTLASGYMRIRMSIP